MGTFVFNVAKGQVQTLFGLPAANDGLVAIPVLSAGLETDAVLRDKTTVAAVFAGATDEATTVGRLPLTAVTVTVDQVNDRVNCDSADLLYSTPPAGGAVAQTLIAYVPDVGVSTDAQMTPISMHVTAFTPDGSTSFQFNTTNDIVRAG